MIKRAILMIFAAWGLLACTTDKELQRIDLSGTWEFGLDREGLITPESELNETVQLPGTTDTNRKGDELTDRGETTHLSRLYSYKGRAWYAKSVEIPQGWAGEPIYLILERTKPTEIYVDGVLVGKSNDICTPQRFELAAHLTPGKHRLAIMVDNGGGIPEQLYSRSHAYTEDTQTNWNGIIGVIALSTSPEVGYKATENAAFNDFHIEGKHFYANGHKIFLRGRLDSCVWPLTGHVAMDLESWRRYFAICQEYGLNHVRFHSWCPPEAAFAAADEYGIFLQPELPFWGRFDSKDEILMDFLFKEGENIIREYGHHPSFRMFALGNELKGDLNRMAEFIAHYRTIAPDKIYTFSPNYYLGFRGVRPENDYFVTCRVGDEGWGNYGTHTRGSFSFADAADGGIINHCYPNTTTNLQEGCSLTDLPIISHETGQFQTFPDYAEIEKYTGALYPCNMEVFRSRLEQKGMIDLVDDFHRASGLWSLKLYKQDIEMDLRTPNMAGFQLLDLQDYAGQGSAYIGILDAFLDSKGLCTPEEWRGWCSSVVPLLIVDKFCFTNDEHIKAKIQVANYGEKSLKGKRVQWRLGDQQGSLTIKSDDFGLIDVGEIDIPLTQYTKATQLEITLAVKGQNTHNKYDLWVYPATHQLEELKKQVVVAQELNDEVGALLEGGANVLLMPEASEQTVGGLFTTDYWNFRMFKTISEKLQRHVSPGTMGILTDPQHPLFAHFPTDMHTNWQWFPVIKASHPFKLDNTATDYRPIVQVIDNIERNHKLGLVFEFAVGKGKLMVVMCNLEEVVDYPEGRQFYISVLEYMTSEHFSPEVQISVENFRKLLSTEVVEGVIGKLFNVTSYKKEEYTK